MSPRKQREDCSSTRRLAAQLLLADHPVRLLLEATPDRLDLDARKMRAEAVSLLVEAF
jgi:hypothetical protein